MSRRVTIAIIAGLLAVAPVGLASAQVPSAAQLQNPELEKNQLKPGANSFAESQARDLLEKQGYSNVSPLMNDKDGIWHGKATKDQKTVDVSVDYRGQIAAK